jgi:hypothetical protein
MRTVAATVYQPAVALRAACVSLAKDDSVQADDWPVLGVQLAVRRDDEDQEHHSHSVVVWNACDEVIEVVEQFGASPCVLIVAPAGDSKEGWDWRIANAADELRERQKKREADSLEPRLLCGQMQSLERIEQSVTGGPVQP